MTEYNFTADCKALSALYLYADVNVGESDLEFEVLESWLGVTHTLLYNRFMVKDRQIPIPLCSNKLRISKRLLECYMSLPNLPIVCVGCLAALRTIQSMICIPLSTSTCYFPEFWYLLTVRVKVEHNVSWKI